MYCILKKGDFILEFDRVTRTKDGILCGIELVSRMGSDDHPTYEDDLKQGEEANPTMDEENKSSESESGGEKIDDSKSESSKSKPSQSKVKKKKKPVEHWDINRFHRVFGHASVTAMEATAEHFGWKLTGKFEACEDCQMSNAQQKKVAKTTESSSSEPGERIFVDMSSVSEHTSLGGSKVWLCAVDDATGCTWNQLMKRKSEAPKMVTKILTRLIDKGYKPKYVRLDDAGELKKLARLCEESTNKGLRDISFEFIAPKTPQRNGKVERKIAVMARRLRATLNAAKLTKDLRRLLWGEAIMYLEDIENTLQSRSYDKPAIVAFYKSMIQDIKCMRQFGEIGYCKFGPKIKGKLKDRGFPMMYLGRPRNHTADTFRMMNLATKAVVISRDVTWMNKVYGEWKQLAQPTMPETVTLLPVEKLEWEAERLVAQEKEANKKQEAAEINKTNKKQRLKTPPRARTISTRATKVVSDPIEGANQSALRELGKLQGTLNPEAQTLASKIKEMAGQDVETREEVELPVDTAASAFTLIDRFGGDIGSFAEYGFLAGDIDPSKFKDRFENPKNYEEAWDHQDTFQREKWREAIELELSKMKEKGVWKKIKRTEMEEGRRCVKHKWVFEIKRSGRFRARLVACGYSQIPGLDFNEVYSAVVNDITLRIAVTLMIQDGLDAIIFDVETAFLHGDLEELIYMDCPKGMVHDSDECLLLVKTIYGLVQSSARYHKKISEVFESLGFKRCPSDPCLFMRGEGPNRLYILLYVDDNFLLGRREEIDRFLEEFRKTFFTFTVDETLDDYLSCEIQVDREKKLGWIGQPHMVKKIEKTFGEEVKNLTEYKTPGTPGFKIQKPEEEDKLIDDDLQSRYRTGVGQIMFLIKHSRPDLMAAVRELAKVLGKATPAAYKELLRCAKFVIDTKHKGLRVDPRATVNGLWELEVFSDSDWAGDPNDRKSVGCYIIFLNGVPIAWRSRSQKVVSLSSSEAEFYACAEAVREVPFIAQILLFMGIPVRTPVDVWIDNVGAIFMTENRTSSSRTRHMDTRWWYVTQMQDEFKMIKVQFVRTKENISDIGTKNVDTETYKYHTKTLLKNSTKSTLR